MNHGEIAGKFSNGRTAVANSNMITDGIENATYRAMTEALSSQNQNRGNGTVVLNVNGREFMRAIYSDMKAVKQREGCFPDQQLCVKEGDEMRILIDGTDITDFIAYQGLKVTRSDIDGPNAGRNLAGTMLRDRECNQTALRHHLQTASSVGDSDTEQPYHAGVRFGSE